MITNNYYKTNEQNKIRALKFDQISQIYLTKQVKTKEQNNVE